MSQPKTRGVVVTPFEVANEGVDAVVDNIAGVGATAIAVSKGVFEVSTSGDGVREPPLDISGEVRILDRPIGGQRVVYLKGYSPYPADPIWDGVPYPPPRLAPEHLRTDYPKMVLDAAHARGLAAHITFSPTVLPGLPGGQSSQSGNDLGFDGDRPVRVDGSIARRPLAGQGCLNNSRVRDLILARVADTFSHYPDADGVFIDWLEYTCYLPKDIFACFCRSCEARAKEYGIEWSDLRHGAARALKGLGELDSSALHRVIDNQPDSLAQGLSILSRLNPDEATALHEHLRFKANSIVALLVLVREVASNSGFTGTIGVNAFAPPWNAITGADYGTITNVADVVRCKLFTFHWAMMARWFGDLLVGLNPGLPPQLVLQAVRTLYQMPVAEGDPHDDLSDYRMPRPDERHPIEMSTIVGKLNASLARVGDRSSALDAYVHGYCPPAQLADMLATCMVSDVGGVWVQRYGYLSDEKLNILRQSWT